MSNIFVVFESHIERNLVIIDYPMDFILSYPMDFFLWLECKPRDLIGHGSVLLFKSLQFIQSLQMVFVLIFLIYQFIKHYSQQLTTIQWKVLELLRGSKNFQSYLTVLIIKHFHGRNKTHLIRYYDDAVEDVLSSIDKIEGILALILVTWSL